MKYQLRKTVEHLSLDNAESVRARILKTIQQLNDLSANSDYADPQVPLSTPVGVGHFGSQSIDESKLSNILGSIKSKHTAPLNENQNYTDCIGLFSKYKKDTEFFKFKAVYLSPDKSGAELRELCSKHLDDYVDLFRAFRTAELLINQKYNAAIHDQALKNLNWQSLKTNELAQIPPVIVELKTSSIDGHLIGRVQEILSTSVPIKLVVYQKDAEIIKNLVGRETALNVQSDLAFACLFLRAVYICQSSNHSEKLDESISAAINSERPALLSLLSADREIAAYAHISRSFVHFTYDPNTSISFQKCIDISDNPEISENWGNDENGYYLTPAHYLFKTGRFVSEFGDGAQLKEKTSLEEFFSGNSNTAPVITYRDQEYSLSNGMVSFCANHFDRWNTLRSLAGIDNPQLVEAINETKAEAFQEKNAELEQLRADLVEKYEYSHKNSMRAVMRNLVVNLLNSAGNEGTGLDLEIPPPSVEDEVTDSAPPAVEVAKSAGPYLETEMCTACDECTTINDQIFAYNKDKQAYIKNPRGGPYRDIVKAAEKCSAAIIHPGEPLDPSEKGLDKWKKRAAKFN